MSDRLRKVVGGPGGYLFPSEDGKTIGLAVVTEHDEYGKTPALVARTASTEGGWEPLLEEATAYELEQIANDLLDVAKNLRNDAKVNSLLTIANSLSREDKQRIITALQREV